MKILVTGSTGFIGQNVCLNLLEQQQELVLLVRPQSMEKAKEIYKDYSSQINFLKGDLTFEDIFIEVEEFDRIKKDVSKVLHLAAEYNLDSSYAGAYINNVVGTHNFINFCKKLSALEEIHYASTMAICGDHSGKFFESDFNVGQKFTNAYAQTKYRAEGLFGSWESEVKKYIYRLGVVTGHSKNGYIPKLDGPYYVIEALNQTKLLQKIIKSLPVLPLPFDPMTRLYFIPIDEVSSALSTMLIRPVSKSKMTTYHLVGPEDGLPIKDFFHALLEFLKIKAHIIPIKKGFYPPQLLDLLKIPTTLVDYMYSRVIFDCTHVKRDYPDLHFSKFSEYKNVFFNYKESKHNEDPL